MYLQTEHCVDHNSLFFYIRRLIIIIIIMFLLFCSWRYNSSWGLPCSSIIFHASQSIAILRHIWIFVSLQPLWHHPPFLTSVDQSSLLHLVYIVILFSVHSLSITRSVLRRGVSWSRSYKVPSRRRWWCNVRPAQTYTRSILNISHSNLTL